MIFKLNSEINLTDLGHPHMVTASPTYFQLSARPAWGSEVLPFEVLAWNVNEAGERYNMVHAVLDVNYPDLNVNDTIMSLINRFFTAYPRFQGAEYKGLIWSNDFI
jgi:hypothetical protein